MKEILSAFGIIIAIIIIVAVIKNWSRIFPPATPSTIVDTTDDELKCEVRNANGQVVTISGKGDEFERICTQSKVNQPVYVYGYPYYFVRYWRPRHHPHPTPPAPTPTP